MASVSAFHSEEDGADASDDSSASVWTADFSSSVSSLSVSSSLSSLSPSSSPSSLSPSSPSSPISSPRQAAEESGSPRPSSSTVPAPGRRLRFVRCLSLLRLPLEPPSSSDPSSSCSPHLSSCFSCSLPVSASRTSSSSALSQRACSGLSSEEEKRRHLSGKRLPCSFSRTACVESERGEPGGAPAFFLTLRPVLPWWLHAPKCVRSPCAGRREKTARASAGAETTDANAGLLEGRCTPQGDTCLRCASPVSSARGAFHPTKETEDLESDYAGQQREETKPRRIKTPFSTSSSTPSNPSSSPPPVEPERSFGSSVCDPFLSEHSLSECSSPNAPALSSPVCSVLPCEAVGDAGEGKSELRCLPAIRSGLFFTQQPAWNLSGADDLDALSALCHSFSLSLTPVSPHPKRQSPASSSSSTSSSSSGSPASPPALVSSRPSHVCRGRLEALQFSGDDDAQGAEVPLCWVNLRELRPLHPGETLWTSPSAPHACAVVVTLVDGQRLTNLSPSFPCTVSPCPRVSLPSRSLSLSFLRRSKTLDSRPAASSPLDSSAPSPQLPSPHAHSEVSPTLAEVSPTQAEVSPAYGTVSGVPRPLRGFVRHDSGTGPLGAGAGVSSFALTRSATSFPPGRSADESQLPCSSPVLGGLSEREAGAASLPALSAQTLWSRLESLRQLATEVTRVKCERRRRERQLSALLGGAVGTPQRERERRRGDAVDALGSGAGNWENGEQSTCKPAFSSSAWQYSEGKDEKEEKRDRALPPVSRTVSSAGPGEKRETREQAVSRFIKVSPPSCDCPSTSSLSRSGLCADFKSCVSPGVSLARCLGRSGLRARVEALREAVASERRSLETASPWGESRGQAVCGDLPLLRHALYCRRIRMLCELVQIFPVENYGRDRTIRGLEIPSLDVLERSLFGVVSPPVSSRRRGSTPQALTGPAGPESSGTGPAAGLEGRDSLSDAQGVATSVGSFSFANGGAMALLRGASGSGSSGFVALAGSGPTASAPAQLAPAEAETLSAAVGFLVHLVVFIQKYLDLPVVSPILSPLFQPHALRLLSPTLWGAGPSDEKGRRMHSLRLQVLLQQHELSLKQLASGAFEPSEGRAQEAGGSRASLLGGGALGRDSLAAGAFFGGRGATVQTTGSTANAASLLGLAANGSSTGASLSAPLPALDWRIQLPLYLHPSAGGGGGTAMLQRQQTFLEGLRTVAECLSEEWGAELGVRLSQSQVRVRFVGSRPCGDGTDDREEDMEDPLNVLETVETILHREMWGFGSLS
ncbi:hypothetical protein TGP89_214120 [Toxoplasma gondii p89]|uniref:Uncharacterized protein n=1 Tax=Toxoplasma gondii p89 TaxID=943119 RepID=A0A086KBU2_TOXGO|nr:hypothetical protein TGP89_214120 [Toxoplasma gondii p89]